MPLMTRHQAKMIAEELYKLMRDDCKAVAKEVTKEENEEYLTVREAAEFLKWSPTTLYKRKNEIGAYTKVGNQLRFPKSALNAMLASGRL